MGRSAIVICLFLVLGTFIASAASAQGQEPAQQADGLLDGRVADRLQKNPLVIGESVIIEEGREVENVLALYGHVHILGTVEGSVLGFRSPIVVGSSGHIEANPDDDEDDTAIVSQDASVAVDEGAVVGGDIYADDVAVAPGATIDGRVQPFDVGFAIGGTGGFISDLVLGVDLFWLALSIAVGVALSTLGLGYLIILFARSGLERTVDVGRHDIGKAIGWGFFTALAVPIAALLASFTVVGFPLGSGVLMAFALFHAVATAVGIFFVARLITRDKFGYGLTFFIGWVVYVGVWLIPGPFGLLFLPVYIATPIYGFGMITVAAWRVRKPRVRSEPEPAST